MNIISNQNMHFDSYSAITEFIVFATISIYIQFNLGIRNDIVLILIYYCVQHSKEPPIKVDKSTTGFDWIFKEAGAHY